MYNIPKINIHKYNILTTGTKHISTYSPHISLIDLPSHRVRIHIKTIDKIAGKIYNENINNRTTIQIKYF